MPFGSGRFVSFGKFPKIPERSEVELRIKSIVTNNDIEESTIIKVFKDHNQMILLIDYEQGEPGSYLEIHEEFSDEGGVIYRNVVEEFQATGIDVNIVPRRYRESGRYRVAIPLCDYKVGIQSRIVGDVTDTVYGIKAVFGAA